MAFSYGFFNSKGLDRTYTAENFCDYLGSLICNGIQDNYGNCFSLSADGLTVTIGTGKAWINGHYFISDTPYNVNLSGFQDESLPRYVAVSIVCDTSENVRDVHIEITAGTPDETPSLPNFPQNEEQSRLILYGIRLNVGATSLTEADWYDYRNDEHLCGYVKCILGKCRITELMDKFSMLTDEVQGLRNDVAELVEVETELQEYIAKMTDLQTKTDALFRIVEYMSGEEITDAGKIGENAEYAIGGNLLKITGSGETYNYGTPEAVAENSPLEENTTFENVEISDKITSLGDSLFMNTNIKEVNIPATVEWIGQFTFAGCRQLETAYISGKIIGMCAFMLCTNLTSVTISTDIEQIENNIFQYSNSLEKIVYEGTTAQWNAIQKPDRWDGERTSGDFKLSEIQCSDGRFVWDDELLEWLEVKADAYTIGENGEITGYNGTSKAIIIPEEINSTSVTKIGGGAFTGTAVEAVKIPEGIEEIE